MSEKIGDLMFGISFPEFVIIAVAAFLIIGPARLASVSYDLGRWIRKFKDQMNELKSTHLKDVDTSPFYEAQTDFNKSLADLKRLPPP